jgi:competence protein ComEC
MPGRPLLGLTVAFVAGIAAGRFVPPAVPPGLLLGTATVLFLLLAGGLLRRFSRFRLPIIPLGCFCSLGLLAASLATPVLPTPPSLDPFFQRLQTRFLAEVAGPPDFYPDKIRLPLRLHSAFVDGKAVPVEGGVLLTLDRPQAADEPWITGDRLIARLTLKRFHNFNNPGGFDYARSQAERGLHARAHAVGSRFLVKVAREQTSLPTAAAHFTRCRLEVFRQRALHWLEGSLEPEMSALYVALLLGYQHIVPKALQEHLNRAGVTHLLAISGFHLALVSIMIFWLARRLARMLLPSVLERSSDKHLALWAAILGAALYAFLTGLATPTWRSLIMLTLVLGASHWYHAADPYSALALAALAILAIAPDTLWQISFQLSFGAVLGLMLLFPRFQKLQDFVWEKQPDRHLLLRRLLGPFIDAFWASWAANIMVLPLIVYHFHGFSLAGLAANTVLVPLVGALVLPLGLAGLALYAVSEPVALVVVKAGAFVFGYSRDLIIWFSGLSWAFFWTGVLPVLWLASFYVVTFLLLSPLKRRAKAGCLLAAVLTPLMVQGFESLGTGRAPSGLAVTFLDVGQGTSTLVRFPSGEAMLVDGGGFYDDSYDLGRAVVAPFLWASGVRKLDYLVLSHDHPDHRNGLKFILSNFKVKTYWETGLTENPAGMSDLAAIAARRGIPVQTLPAILAENSVGNCRIKVLHPTSTYLEKQWGRDDLNNVSLVIRIEYGATRLILPGDIDQSVENLLFESYVPHGPLLVASPHHGSARSNGKSLFDHLRPDFLVFSCGYDNWFGFPAPAVLEQSRRHGIPYYRTDLWGAIQAVSDGNRWTIQPAVQSTVGVPENG